MSRQFPLSLHPGFLTWFSVIFIPIEITTLLGLSSELVSTANAD